MVTVNTKNPNFFVFIFLLVQVFSFREDTCTSTTSYLVDNVCTCSVLCSSNCFTFSRVTERTSVVYLNFDRWVNRFNTSFKSSAETSDNFTFHTTYKTNLFSFCSFCSSDTSKVTSFVIGINSRCYVLLSFNTVIDDDIVHILVVFCSFFNRVAQGKTNTKDQFVVVRNSFIKVCRILRFIC